MILKDFTDSCILIAILHLFYKPLKLHSGCTGSKLSFNAPGYGGWHDLRNTYGTKTCFKQLPSPFFFLQPWVLLCIIKHSFVTKRL